MNEQDRKDLRSLDRKVDSIKDDIHMVHLEVKDLVGIISVDEEKIDTVTTDLLNTKIDYEKRFRKLEFGNAKTIAIATVIGSVTTGIIWYLTI